MMSKAPTRQKQTVRAKAPGEKARPSSRRGGQSWFAQHQAVAVDSLSRLVHEPGSSFLTWAVIGIALALPLSLMLVLLNLRQINTSLDDAGNISLYMTPGISAGELDDARNLVQVMEGVDTVTMITAEQALQEFQATSGFGDALEGLDDNPLPAVLIVKPLDASPAALGALVTNLDGVAGVDSTQVDLEWVRRLDGIIRLAQRFTTGLALLLCLGVVLAVGNTVRLAIENRRDEVLVVKLVGGTDAYVARPFLYTGIWYGVGGGIIALLLVLLSTLFLAGPVSSLVTLYESDFNMTGLSISDMLLVLVVAGALGLAGAWLSVLRHLRRIEPV